MTDPMPARPERVELTEETRLRWNAGAPGSAQIPVTSWEWPGARSVTVAPSIELTTKGADPDDFALYAFDGWEGASFTLAPRDARELAGALLWFAALVEGTVSRDA